MCPFQPDLRIPYGLSVHKPVVFDRSEPLMSASSRSAPVKSASECDRVCTSEGLNLLLTSAASSRHALASNRRLVQHLGGIGSFDTFDTLAAQVAEGRFGKNRCSVRCSRTGQARIKHHFHAAAPMAALGRLKSSKLPNQIHIQLPASLRGPRRDTAKRVSVSGPGQSPTLPRC